MFSNLYGTRIADGFSAAMAQSHGVKVDAPAALEALRRSAKARRAQSHRQARGASGEEEDGAARTLFRKFAHQVSLLVGTPSAFILALVVLVAWAVAGPVFGFSDTWQL